MNACCIKHIADDGIVRSISGSYIKPWCLTRVVAHALLCRYPVVLWEVDEFDI